MVRPGGEKKGSKRRRQLNKNSIIGNSKLD